MATDLSVVIIGRDEALTLPRALQSIRAVANQIVFVDTGSSDNTRTIAHNYGCEVFDFCWNDNFAAARNAGLERATSKWILTLDCDEQLANSTIAGAQIEQICSSSLVQAYRVSIDNLQRDGGITCHEALRIFRNDNRIRFRNPVHESVGESIYEHWPHQPVPLAEFRLNHYGYAQGQNDSKLERNLTILRSWLEREPLNIYASYKCGITLQKQGNIEAIEWLGRGFELLDRRNDKRTFPFGINLANAYIKCLERYGLCDEAVKIRERLANWP
jgi:glycosyltransferase involved in cell wall biosynthesis